jgi:lantibiotic modifying enzyme
MKSLISIVLITLFFSPPMRAADGPYREAALGAARWIKASALKTEQGITWPADPLDKKSTGTTLYSGSPGIILFMLEAYNSTSDKAFLQDARAGSDHLLASVHKEESSGFYVGVAGIGFSLVETFKATGDQKYRQGALKCAQLIRERATKNGKGVEWNDSTDVISGGAGIGLFLLYAARELNEPGLVNLAAEGANRLIELAQAEAGGKKWAMTPSFKRLMPNFSHGTAGVAYFLATLYQETRRAEFLDAALAGATYLKAVAKTDGDVCLVFHNEPDGRELYYLGWCHGPVGTARLFYRLYQATGDGLWLEWVKKSARALVQSGIPEKQTSGFWNNVSQCCGSAGVAEFSLNMYEMTRDRAYLDFSKRVTANLIARATSERNGMKWIQAEHRVRPELLVAQTGYMQGAAGIGMLLLRLDNFERGKKARIRFPDSPF